MLTFDLFSTDSVLTWNTVSTPASKQRHLLQWNVVTPCHCLPILLISTSVFKQGFSLTFIFFFLSFVPALKRLSLGLLFLVTYTLSSPYISDEYLISDDYMVCIYLTVLIHARILLLWRALDLQEQRKAIVLFRFASIQKEDKSATSAMPFTNGEFILDSTAVFGILMCILLLFSNCLTITHKEFPRLFKI